MERTAAPCFLLGISAAGNEQNGPADVSETKGKESLFRHKLASLGLRGHGIKYSQEQREFVHSGGRGISRPHKKSTLKTQFQNDFR